MALKEVGDKPRVKIDARTEWRTHDDNPELFLVIELSSEKESPESVVLQIPNPSTRKPATPVTLADIGNSGLVDTHQRQWTAANAVPGKSWKLTLKKLDVSGPKPAAPGIPWSLKARVLLRAIDKETELKVNIATGGGEDAFAIAVAPQVLAEESPAQAVVILDSDAQDTSALKYGSTFKLKWEVSGVTRAELWGPLSDDGNNRKVLFPEPKDKPGSSKGSKSVTVTGPMNFTLHATVSVNDRLEEVVRSVTVGMLTDPRGGRLDVWPRQVLPRGPIACRWSAFKVTELKFHAITGDVLDDETDGPAILNDEFGYQPTDPRWETTIQGVPFTLEYGPRAGQAWAVDAECEPEGDPRLLQCRVSAIGTRKLASSVVGSDSNQEQWSYLAVGESVPKEDQAPQADASSRLQVISSQVAVGMAAGRFAAKDSDGPERWREWIAIATTECLDVHINKLVNQRAYRVNPGLHPGIAWLKPVLDGGVLGVAAAEIVVGEGEKSLTRGENVVVVRRGRASVPGELVVKEFRFPLKTSEEPRTITFEDKGFASVKKVYVVALWPRVYILGTGICYSYDRSVVGKDGRGKDKEWKAEHEPLLTQVASPEWEIVPIPKPRGESGGVPRGGYLFAMTKKNGQLWRFEVKDGAVIKAPFVEMESANGRVARLHDLQSLQANATLDSQTEDGRILLGRDERGGLKWVNPINEESVLMVIGGALVARSEVHDPLVQPVYSQAEPGRPRRGLQDRAYNPRLDLWVRCGHPFHHTRSSEKALFESTSRSLYCRAPNGEITYISPIEPSHLGFLAADLAPRVEGFKGRAGLAAFDTLFSGQSLTREQFLESTNGKYRLTYTREGDVVLHANDDAKKALWTLRGQGRWGVSAVIQFDANLVLTNEVGDPITSVYDAAVTVGTLLRDMPEAARVSTFANVRLIVTNDGHVECLAKVGGGVKDEVIWGAPSRSLGDALLAGETMAPWEYLESKGREHRLYQSGNLSVLRVADGVTVWESGASASPWKVRMLDTGELVVLQGPDKAVWRSSDWGGLKDESEKKYAGSALRLGSDGSPTVEKDSVVLWRVPKSFKESMPAGEWLAPGTCVASPNGEYQLRYQIDGNLVLYQGSVALWASHTPGRSLGRVTLQRDGNLVLEDASGTVHWAANRVGGSCGGNHSNGRLVAYDEGYFKVLGQGGETLYSNRWVRLQNGGRYLHAGGRSCNDEINFKENDHSWWDFRGNLNGCTFHLVGTNPNLYLSYRDATGRAKLYDSALSWKLEVQKRVSHAEVYWSLKSNQHDQFLHEDDGAPYVTGKGSSCSSSKEWKLLGGLLEEGLKRG